MGLFFRQHPVAVALSATLHLAIAAVLTAGAWFSPQARVVSRQVAIEAMIVDEDLVEREMARLEELEREAILQQEHEEREAREAADRERERLAELQHEREAQERLRLEEEQQRQAQLREQRERDETEQREREADLESADRILLLGQLPPRACSSRPGSARGRPGAHRPRGRR